MCLCIPYTLTGENLIICSGLPAFRSYNPYTVLHLYILLVFLSALLFETDDVAALWWLSMKMMFILRH